MTVEGMLKTPDPKLMEAASALIAEVMAAAPELSKQGLNLDHGDVMQILVAVSTLRTLREIRDELRVQNHATRMKMNPLSMMNLGGMEPHED